MSAYEAVMLLCFGAAWPFSLYKSYTSRQNGSKSVVFLVIVLVGYAAGIAHKITHNYDAVIYLYIINGAMVTVDIALYCRNRRS